MVHIHIISSHPNSHIPRETHSLVVTCSNIHPMNLRRAKECISQSDFKECLKFCKKAIQEDSKSYHAFVFAGFANWKLGEFSHANKAYTVATELEPNSKDAWLGLLELYGDINFPLEKKYETVLTKLVELFRGTNKGIDYTLKLIPYVRDVKSKLGMMESIMNAREMPEEFYLEMLELEPAKELRLMLLKKMKDRLPEHLLVDYVKENPEDYSLLGDSYPNSFYLFEKRILEDEKSKKKTDQRTIMRMIHAHPDQPLSIVFWMDYFDNSVDSKEHFYETYLEASQSVHARLQYAEFCFSRSLWKKTLTVIGKLESPLVAKCWIKLKDYEQAKLYATSNDLLGYILMKQGDLDGAILLLENDPVLLGWCYVKKKDFSIAFQVVSSAKGPMTPKDTYKLARIHYFAKEFSTATALFLDCLKYKPMVLYYLSMLYEPKDMTRAVQCLKRAIQLDKKEFFCLQLGDLYERNNLVHEANAFYATCLDYEWAMQRLAFGSSDLEMSLKCFLKLVSLKPKDALAWQGLGDVYLKQGKYLAALKSFAKSYELDSSLSFSIAQLANVHRILGEWTEARQVLEKCPKDDFWCLSAFGSLCMDEARQDEILGLSGKDNWESARGYFVRCLEMNPIASHWKSLADCHLALNSKKEASNAILKALELFPEDPGMWYDLYLCGGPNSIDYLIKSIKLDPKQGIFWNALGMAKTDLYEKQHCFIRGVQCNDENSWLYLGFLYLEHSEYDLARKCFLNAQVQNPTKALPWVGLGLLHESLPNQGEKCVDLFEHAISLEDTFSSQISLGHHLYKQGKYEKALHCFTKCISSNDEVVWNMLGLCLEKLNQLISSKECFSRGKSKECSLNLARVLSKLGEYAKSMEIYSKYEFENEFSLVNSFKLGIKTKPRLDTASKKNIMAKVFYQSKDFDSAIATAVDPDLIACLRFKKDPSAITKTVSRKLQHEMNPSNGTLLKGIFWNPTDSALWNQLIVTPNDAKAILKQLDGEETAMKQALIQYQCGKVQKSFSLASRILLKNPLDERARKFINTCWLNNPILKIEALIKIDPTDAMNLIKSHMSYNEPVMFGLLTRCLFEKKDPKWSGILQNALKKFPSELYLYQIWFEIESMETRFESAISVLELMKKMDPIYYQVQLAFCHYKLGDSKTALKHIVPVLSQTNSAAIYFLVGKIQFSIEKKLSKPYFLKSYEMDPNSKLINHALYDIHYSEENWEAAEQDLWYQKDIFESAHLYYELGKFAHESDQKQAAKLMFYKAIRMDPTKPVYFKMLSAK